MFWADQPDDGRICLLGLEGSLSGSDLVDLAGRLRGLAAQGVLRVVVDLRNVDYWEPRGLRALAEAVEHRRDAGAVTAFVIPNPVLTEAAAAVGVLETFDRYDDLQLEEAPRRNPVPPSSVSRNWPVIRTVGE